MQEHILFLGTGSGFSSLPNTNILLNYTNCRVLIDFGFTGLGQLRTFDIRPDTIDALIITHMHSDHIGGIEMLAYILKFKYNKKLLLILPHFEFKFMLWDALKNSMKFSPHGIMQMSDYFDTIIAYRTDKVYKIRFKSHDFLFVKTKHIPGMLSFGVMFNINTKKVFYTSDIIFDPEFLMLVNNKYTPSVIIHDCKTDASDEKVHASYRRLKTLPVELKKKMLLIHYDDNFIQFDPQKDGFMGFAKGGDIFIP